MTQSTAITAAITAAVTEVIAAGEGHPKRVFRKPTTSAERAETRYTFPIIHKQLAIVRGLQWGASPWPHGTMIWDVKDMVAPLGQTAAAVVTYRGRLDAPGTRSVIDLPLWEIRGNLVDGWVQYSTHGFKNLGWVAFPEAAGKIINAAPVTPDLIEDADMQWAWLGLQTLREGVQAAQAQVQPETVPVMPKLLVKCDPSNVAIGGRVAAVVAAGIARCDVAYAVANLQEVLSRRIDGRTIRQIMCRQPMVAGNPTNHWLVRADYLCKSRLPNTEIFEDFKDLCGAQVPNPYRFCGTTLSVMNTARLAAYMQGEDSNGEPVVDVLSCVRQLNELQLQAESAKELDVRWDEASAREVEGGITDKLVSLIPTIRDLLGPLESFYSDEAILPSLLNPREEMRTVIPPVTELSGQQKDDLAVGVCLCKYPHLADKLDCADLDLAAGNPTSPLFARRMGVTQNILFSQRGVQLGAEDLGAYRTLTIR